MLDRPPRGFQQQPVLRVHEHRFTRRHPEERGVEPPDILDEARPACHHLADGVGIGIEEFLDIPTVLRYLRDRVAPAAQVVPELVRIGGAREAHRIADYREATARAFQFAYPRPQGLDSLQGPLLQIGHFRSPISSSRLLSFMASPQSPSTLSFPMKNRARRSARPSTKAMKSFACIRMTQCAAPSPSITRGLSVRSTRNVRASSPSNSNL